MGERIRRLRRAQGKTQEIFADENFISTSYLGLLETGRRAASIDVLVQIASSCHTTIDYLILGEPDTAISPLHRKFTQLCEQYPNERVKKALDLMEFYLELDKT